MTIGWKPEELIEAGYKINQRTFGDAKDIIRHLDNLELQQIERRDNEFLYSGAEHTGKPKLPNITYLPNISYTFQRHLLGSTFGHQHMQCKKNDNRQFQEIYEFQTAGAMLLRSPESTRLVLATNGEKIIVKTDEAMTLFNLDINPLITIDYANPEMNSATKDLEKRLGPLMAILKTERNICFNINQSYRNENLIDGEENFVSIQTQETGNNLIKIIESLKKNFYQSGIKIISGGNLPESLKHEFSRPLSQLIKEKNETLMETLKIT